MNTLQVRKLIESFLIEDIGNEDLSAKLIFEENKTGKGIFISKDNGIISGTELIDATYKCFGHNVNIDILKKDGEEIKTGEIIAKVEGSVVALLSCERIILNLIQKMSGIATTTKKAIELLNDTSIRVCDTRKTTPGLRIFEKYAVTCGGGYNHRFGLYDGIMLKDNHIAFAGGITNAVNIVKSKIGHMVKIEVETETEAEVLEAVNAGTDIIMFDNRSPEEVRKLCKLVPSNIITEVSGGINLENIASYSNTGADYISIGSLTHSSKPLDISFNSMEGKKTC